MHSTFLGGPPKKLHVLYDNIRLSVTNDIDNGIIQRCSGFAVLDML